MEVHLAAERVARIAMWCRNLLVFSFWRKEIALVLPMGEPPPTEMRVSIDESLAMRPVASSSWAIGACCLMLEKSAGMVFGAEKLFDLLD
jgi:hypothetical protein